MLKAAFIMNICLSEIGHTCVASSKITHWVCIYVIFKQNLHDCTRAFFDFFIPDNCFSILDLLKINKADI